MKRRVKERSESALLSKGCCPIIMDASAVATACLERCHASPSRSSAATEGNFGYFHLVIGLFSNKVLVYKKRTYACACMYNHMRVLPHLRLPPIRIVGVLRGSTLS